MLPAAHRAEVLILRSSPGDNPEGYQNANIFTRIIPQSACRLHRIYNSLQQEENP